MGKKSEDWEEQFKTKIILSPKEQQRADKLYEKMKALHLKKFGEEMSEENDELVRRKLPYYTRYGYESLSHHSPCHKFKGHAFRIGTSHYCIGCYVGYPSGIFGFLSGFIFDGRVINNTFTFLYLGLIFMSAILLSYSSVTEHMPVKIFQKCY